MMKRSEESGSPALLRLRRIATRPTDLRPLRIAFLSHRSNPKSGAEGVYVRYLTRALVRQGHQVDVISGPPYPELDPPVRLVPLPGASGPSPDIGARIRPSRAADLWANGIEWLIEATGGTGALRAFGLRASAYLRSQPGRYDVVHDNQTLAPAIARLATQGVPVVATIHHPSSIDRLHGLEEARGLVIRLRTRRRYGFVRMQARVARRLERIVTVSASTRCDVSREFGVPLERMAVVHNGIDTDVFRPLAETRRLSNRIVANVSADIPMKGLSTLLQAFALLGPEHQGTELVVIGSPRADGVTALLIDSLRIGGRVRFTGPLNHGAIVRHYSEATIAVVPSLYEGFGLPAGEAMACGVPIIATTGGALPEVVGDAGMLVPPGDACALTEALCALLRDSAGRALMAARGRERIMRSFTWDGAAGSLIDLYRGMGAGGASQLRPPRPKSRKLA